MREIVSVLGLPDKPMEVEVPEDLAITTMTRYNAEFPFSIAYPPASMDNVLAEWLAKQGANQCHIAETEKYAHVTFFFNGGVEKQFKAEDRHMIPSPKVATYDKKPEMSVQAVADKVAEVVKTNDYDFVMCNFAPPDMVGHTGVYDAAVEAITATDAAVKTVYDACEEAGYVLCVTADHGNAEQMLDPETGNPHTAHTTSESTVFEFSLTTQTTFRSSSPVTRAASRCRASPVRSPTSLRRFSTSWVSPNPKVRRCSGDSLTIAEMSGRSLVAKK
jgi:2,3-bisphosphoglycerate-independent phosphoglycerate mutase